MKKSYGLFLLQGLGIPDTCEKQLPVFGGCRVGRGLILHKPLLPE